MMLREGEILPAGKLLGGRYRIQHVLGEGGMGVVYLVEDTRLRGKQWAVKMFRPSTQGKERLEREAGMLMSLDHPDLPNIVDVVHEDELGLSGLVTDVVKGKTLEERLAESGGQWEEARIARYTWQICKLLRDLHAMKPQPIIYRDLKPSNVMIDERDTVRLIDFGIARYFHPARQTDTERLGTKGYAAPEQYQNRQTDQRSDLYNLGALLYFMLSGGQEYRLGKKLAIDHPKRSPQIAEFVHKLLRIQPEHRFQSAEEAMLELSHIYPVLAHTLHLEQLPKSEHDHSASKVIVIGSLYRGAGATFIALALARMLHRKRIDHALIECVYHEPVLYALLGGHTKRPGGYRFLADRVLTGERVGNRNTWHSGYTSWHPLPADRMWDEHQLHPDEWAMLQAVQEDYRIVDIGDRWEDAGVRRLLREADHIVCVLDSMLAKQQLIRSRKRVEKLLDGTNRGAVHWVLNHTIDQRDCQINVPAKRCHLVPHIPFAYVSHAMRKGRLVQDHKKVATVLDEALQALVERLFIQPDRVSRAATSTLI